MNKAEAGLLIVLAGLVVEGTALAQTPTGNIAGTVRDPSGLPVAARLSVLDRANGLSRSLTTSMEGNFSAVALPPGIYQITVEASGFHLLERTVTVEAGATTSIDLVLELGELTEKVTIDDAVPLIHYDHHQVSGLVSRVQIENLPLNGRNFLELAKLEGGVTNPIRASNNRTIVPTLGAGSQGSPRIGYTRASVDGVSIMAISALGAALNVSQDVVQEFQISTVNMDLSASLTSNGSINIVTRSGGNAYHGSGFYFYRDHNLSAYPGLQRDVSSPDPFFQRRQFGYQLGGPIRKDRTFFFTSYERNDQRGVLSIQPATPEFAPLGGVFPSPSLGNQFNLRLDQRLNAGHNAFVRFTHDDSRFFGPNDFRNTSLPSGWSRVTTWADQSLAALTSVLSPRLVNDVRFSYFFFSAPQAPANTEDCPGCLGVGAPRINIPDAGVVLGGQQSASFVGRRYQITESLAWQKGDHRLRFGFDWEHARVSSQRIEQEPATIDLYSPRQVRQFNRTAPSAAQIPLPPSFLTMEDILQLPLRGFLTSVGPGLVPQRNFRKFRRQDLYRLYATDTWRIHPRLTVNYGLAWAYDPNSLNTDLSKSRLLEPILGSDGLGPPTPQETNFSPGVGFAWSPTRDAKTVIRGGAGRYFDPLTLSFSSIINERLALSPSGTGRRANIPGSSISYNGGSLDFNQKPTPLTGADLLAILPGIRAELMAQLNPNNRDFTFRNLDLNKSGENLFDPSYQAPYAIHFSLGLQRELAANLVLSADFAWRRFLHTMLFGIDYNRYRRQPQGPMIPGCVGSQSNDLTAVCSTGPITFDNTSGIAEYQGLLVRLEKRLSHRTQFLVSYALGSFTGSNGTEFPGNGFNVDSWFENYGPVPTDQRHVLNLSGFAELPGQLQASFNLSLYSRPPFSAYLNGVDFNGDGTVNDLLPGARVNQFNRGFSEGDLASLVKRYNQEFAGKRTLGGQTAPLVILPARYAFNDSFFTQDLRLSRTFSLSPERMRLVLLAEVFNLLNSANLVQYGGNIANPAGFGQPGARFTQVFGSGGPRAFQLGMKLTF